jgi:hypothetical protein
MAVYRDTQTGAIHNVDEGPVPEWYELISNVNSDGITTFYEHTEARKPINWYVIIFIVILAYILIKRKR